MILKIVLYKHNIIKRITFISINIMKFSVYQINNEYYILTYVISPFH